MKKLALISSSLILSLTASMSLTALELTHDLTPSIPQIDVSASYGFQKTENVAQYKNADWSTVVGIAKNISLNDAYRIANDNPDISFFFYTKGFQMVLETEDGGYRIFHHGDTVFFSGTPWWGSAPGLADGYEKQCSIPEKELRNPMHSLSKADS